jgi:hypothetical protein
MNSFSNVVNRMHMEFGGNLLDSLRIKTRVFDRP